MKTDEQLIWEAYLINESLADFVERISANPEFQKWFGDSKVIGLNGNPLIVFHGTSKYFDEFSEEFLGIGDDQYGSGFYFTGKAEIASMYAAKEGNDKIGNVRPVFLKIENPWDHGEIYKIHKSKIMKLIKSSPELDEVLEDFGEVGYEGYNTVLNKAFSSVIRGDNSYDFDDLININVTFYPKSTKQFLLNVKNILGFDGVRGDEDLWVAWFTNQIRSIYSFKYYENR